MTFYHFEDPDTAEPYGGPHGHLGAGVPGRRGSHGGPRLPRAPGLAATHREILSPETEDTRAKYEAKLSYLYIC